MDRRTRYQLLAFVAASYAITGLTGWAAVKLVQEISTMCICPTTEKPATPATPENQASILTDLLAKAEEASHYIGLHHPEVVAQIKAMGVSVPAFSVQAPVIRDLVASIKAAAPVLGLELAS